MKKLNIYLKEWREATDKANKLLSEGDHLGYTDMMNKAGDIAIQYNEARERICECSNYGISNFLLEGALPYLIKNDTKTVRRVMNCVKEDKNLKGEFAFFKALENYNPSFNAKEYLEEALAMVKQRINKNTLNESNKKFCGIVQDADIIPEEKITEERKNFYNACTYLIEHNKGLLNLGKYNACLKTASDFVSETYNKNLNENKENIYKLMENFNTKYSNILNEEEKSFVQDIIDAKASDRGEKQEKLFNKLKEECLNTIEKLISESTGEAEKYGLIGIKEQIEGKIYNEATVVQDFAKILEIRDILSEQ